MFEASNVGDEAVGGEGMEDVAVVEEKQ